MTIKNTISISLNNNSPETKLQQLINEIIRVIHTDLNEGDSLPSVNTLSRKLNISRDTVFKAYRELKKRQVVDATPTKGYFVNREMNRILLLLDYYSPFKDIVYREIEKNIGKDYSVDLVFHHYNKRIFESVILGSIGRYNKYLIMNFDICEFEICEVLRKIDPSKLLLLDIPVRHWKDFDLKKYAYVWQNFDEAVYNCLSDISDRIKKYNSFNLIIPDSLHHPPVTIQAFEQFCSKNHIKSGIINDLSVFDVNERDAFFVLREKDMATLLKMCKDRNYATGIDIGILAYNELPIYEFVSSGITVISTDFREMGRKACRFITDGEDVKEILPTRVIIRNSI